MSKKEHISMFILGLDVFPALLACHFLAMGWQDTIASARCEAPSNASHTPNKHMEHPTINTTNHSRITRRLLSPSGPPGPEGPPKKCVDGRIFDSTFYTTFLGLTRRIIRRVPAHLPSANGGKGKNQYTRRCN